MNCKICYSTSELFLTATLFKEREKVDYYKCVSCDFIQTQEPTWLEKAYSDIIAKSDIGLIYRNIYVSNILEKFLLKLYPDVQTILDYGGGYGMFTRIMRDKGFDFYWHDEFCKNIFAEGFEGNLNDEYDIICSFEVFEHLPEPLEVIPKLLGQCKMLVFSTELHDGISDFKNWWYRAEMSGQHVSFFSKKSMLSIAQKYNVEYYTFGNGALHAFSKLQLNRSEIEELWKERSLLQRIKDKLSGKTTLSRQSLLGTDYEKIITNYLNSSEDRTY